MELVVVNLAEFNAALKRYLDHTSKDLAYVLNQKAFFIARGATRNIRRANYSKIAKQLGVKLRRVRKGKRAGSLTMGSNATLIANRKYHSEGEMSLAEAIILKRRKDKGLPFLPVAERQDAALRMIGARARSIGFLAAGFLGSIKAFASALNKPFFAGRGESAFAKNAIDKLGYGIIARPGFRPRAFIVNRANAKHDHKEALIRYGVPAVQEAINKESASMIQYVEKKLKESARSQGIRVH